MTRPTPPFGCTITLDDAKNPDGSRNGMIAFANLVAPIRDWKRMDDGAVWFVMDVPRQSEMWDFVTQRLPE